MTPRMLPRYTRPDRNRRVLLTRRPNGIPQADDFSLDEGVIPRPGEGQLLIRNIYLSVDPAQRGWAADASNYSAPVPLGGVMRALAVGEIIESRAPGFEAGQFVYGWFDWQDYAVAEPDLVLHHIPRLLAPLSAYAGPLGINGLTAELAFARLGRPERGDAVVVSTAAGAVGSLVGQLARASGCRTLGLTGDPEKVRRCVERFGYDDAVDYKTEDVGEAVSRFSPDGIDIYFDNVGGSTLDALLTRMKIGGRIVQCGTASVARWSPAPVGPRVEREILTRRLSWNGFVIFDHRDRFAATASRLAALIASGDLVYDEDISTDFASAPGAIARLYAGQNRGKAMIFLS
jgi:NADPH-dependent curcumin reductase CurA